MNKAELIEALSAHYDGSKTEAAKALNAVVQTITYKTAAGEKVSITGFGVFEKVHRSARMVRNPRTGERKKAKATAVPRFRAGTDLKAYVSGAKKVPRTTATRAAPAKSAATKAAPAKTAAAKSAASKAPAKTAAAKTTSAAKTVAKKATPTKTTAAKKTTTAAKKTTPAAKQTTARKTPAKKST